MLGELSAALADLCAAGYASDLMLTMAGAAAAVAAGLDRQLAAALALPVIGTTAFATGAN